MNLETQFEKQKLISIVNQAQDLDELRKVTVSLINLYFNYKETVKTMFKGQHNPPESWR